MRTIKFNKLVASLRRSIVAGLFSVFFIHAAAVAQPVISPPVWGTNQSQAQLTLSNCTDTNVQYLIQMSTNLTDWQPVQTLAPSPTNFSVTVWTTNQLGYYRVRKLPGPFPTSTFSIFCKSNFNLNGNNCTFDSFDSSNPNYSTSGLYDPAKRRANACIATDATITNVFGTGNLNIYGTAYTGVGTTSNSVFHGLNCSVGDLLWVPNISGIQLGHWFGNLSEIIPDVAAPDTTGWATTLPTSSNGWINLNGNYVLNGTLNSALQVSGPSKFWLKRGASKATISINPGAQLILFLGNTSGVPVSFSLSGNGNQNTPGFASNFQIYGLPTLTSVDLSGNAGWTGTLYAPEAAFLGGSGGNNTTNDSFGAIVVGSCTLNGRWNFHYDERLSRAGLLY